MSHFLDRLTFFNRTVGDFSDGHGITTREDRRWEDGYRKRWQHDKIVRSTHGANCTGSCSWKMYVKGGIVTWETQQTDYPRTRPELPNHEPRGCSRGASYSWYLYSGNRVKYPLVRSRLLKLWREARALRTPVAAWGSIVEDPKKRAAYTAEFRGDIETFVSLEVLNRCTNSIGERLPEWSKSYAAFVDPSGGSNDSMTLAVAHAEGKLIVLDAIREVVPPFSPNAVVEQFAEVLRQYQVWTVYGDRYAGEWCREPFIQRNVGYEISERAKSDIYRDFLPLLNSRAVVLLDNRRMRQQFLALERRTTRGGRDSIDHPPGGHDDIANAVAGACLAAIEHAGAVPAHRLQLHAIDNYDVLATAEENAIAMAHAEQRGGYFSGRGWAPTWHDDAYAGQQTHAID